MRIFLDDMRDTPPNWVRTYTAEKTIEFLKNNNSGERIRSLSLDNDLGEGLAEGYHVARFIEENAFLLKETGNSELLYAIPLNVIIHTANSEARKEMQIALNSAGRFLRGITPLHVIIPKYSANKYTYALPDNDWA